jgi:DNA polymerase III epsilon subunit-like protein
MYNPYMTPRFVCIDTETTGLGNDARILEIGMIFSEDGMIVDSWSQRFNPKEVDWESPSVQGALAVNRIDPASLVGCPDFADAVEVVDLFLSRYKVWVGHNLSYDLRMLTNEFTRAGRSMFTKSSAFTVCTKELARYFDTLDCTKNSHKLNVTADRFGVKIANAHTAVGDAMATAEILLKMVEGRRLPLKISSIFAKLAKEEAQMCTCLADASV